MEVQSEIDMKYKYVGTDIDVPDNFEEWHIKLLLDYKRIYETPKTTKMKIKRTKSSINTY